MYYSVSILLQARIGTVQQSIWLAVPVASAQLVGCIIGGLVIDRAGRKPLVLLSLLGAALSLGLEGSAFLLDGSMCNATDTAAPLGGTVLAAGGEGSAAGGGSALDVLCALRGWVTVGGMVIYLVCACTAQTRCPAA